MEFPELEVFPDQAEALVKGQVDKQKVQQTIAANIKLMDRSKSPKPEIVTLMVTTYSKNPNQDIWFLEVLQRLSNGTLRQLRERGEI